MDAPPRDLENWALLIAFGKKDRKLFAGITFGSEIDEAELKELHLGGADPEQWAKDNGCALVDFGKVSVYGFVARDVVRSRLDPQHVAKHAGDAAKVRLEAERVRASNGADVDKRAYSAGFVAGYEDVDSDLEERGFDALRFLIDRSHGFADGPNEDELNHRAYNVWDGVRNDLVEQGVLPPEPTEETTDDEYAACPWYELSDDVWRRVFQRGFVEGGKLRMSLVRY